MTSPSPPPTGRTAGFHLESAFLHEETRCLHEEKGFPRQETRGLHDRTAGLHEETRSLCEEPAFLHEETRFRRQGTRCRREETAFLRGETRSPTGRPDRDRPARRNPRGGQFILANRPAAVLPTASEPAASHRFTQPRAAMIQIALKLGTLTETDTVTLASTVITSLPNASGVTPDPTVPALTTLRNTAQEALDAVGPKVVA